MTQRITYTLVGDGEPVRGLTAAELGRRILEADGYAWDIACPRPRDPTLHRLRYYRLRRSDGSAASTRGARHLRLTVYSTFALNRAEAEAELLARIGGEGPSGWRGCGRWESYSDDDYDTLVAELED